MQYLGMPVKSDRIFRVKVSLHPDEYRWVEKLAKRHDLPLADFCRRRVFKKPLPAFPAHPGGTLDLA